MTALTDLSRLPESDEQTALREAVFAVVQQRSGQRLWTTLAGEMGLVGLAVAESVGGAGAGFAEIAVVVEELGRALSDVPFLSTSLAAMMIGEASDPAAHHWLPGLMAGTSTAAFAFDTDIEVADGLVSGRARYVLDGPLAELFLVRDGVDLLVVSAADTTVTPIDTLDQTRTQSGVEWAGAAALRLGDAALRAEQLFQVLLAVESVGASAHCLASTVDYLKTRVQFGRPIGSFQALAHRCADLAVELSSAAATARAAVSTAATAGPDLAVLAPLAKRHCAEVFRHVTAEMIQLHGGIGFTWEHETHRYFKRAKANQLLLGTPDQLRRLVAARAGLV